MFLYLKKNMDKKLWKKNNFMLEIITPLLCWGSCCAFLAVGTLLAVSNDKGGVALLPLTNWSTRRSSFVQDSPNAPSVTLKSFISSTSQRSSKKQSLKWKKDMGFYFVYIFHITYIKKMYTETERERDSPFWVDVEPPPSNAQICLNTPTAPSKPSQGRPYLFHRHSSPGVFSESHKKKTWKKNREKPWGKKVCPFFNPHGKRIFITSQTNWQLLHPNKNVGMDQKKLHHLRSEILTDFFLVTDMSQRRWPPRRSPRHWPSWCRTWPTSEKRDDKPCVYVCYHFLIKRSTISCDYVCSLL